MRSDLISCITTENTTQFLKDLNSLKISTAPTVNAIVKARFPLLDKCELFLVGDQTFTKQLLFERYPGLKASYRYEDHLAQLFNLETFKNMHYYVCLLSADHMDKEFNGKRVGYEGILEKYGKLSIKSDS